MMPFLAVNGVGALPLGYEIDRSLWYVFWLSLSHCVCCWIVFFWQYGVIMLRVARLLFCFGGWVEIAH